MRRALALVAVVGIALVGFSRPALARATKTPFTAIETKVSSTPPERQWLSGHIFHLRGEVDTSALTGDLEGTLVEVDNVNVDVNTGRGVVFGTFVITTSTVSWAGNFSGTLSATGGSGKFEGQGTDGSKIAQATFTSISPNQVLDSGTILNPHG